MYETKATRRDRWGTKERRLRTEDKVALNDDHATLLASFTGGCPRTFQDLASSVRGCSQNQNPSQMARAFCFFSLSLLFPPARGACGPRLPMEHLYLLPPRVPHMGKGPAGRRRKGVVREGVHRNSTQKGNRRSPSPVYGVFACIFFESLRRRVRREMDLKCQTRDTRTGKKIGPRYLSGLSVSISNTVLSEPAGEEPKGGGWQCHHLTRFRLFVFSSFHLFIFFFSRLPDKLTPTGLWPTAPSAAPCLNCSR